MNAVANYTRQQQAFTKLIETTDEPNILLFQGESGSGKTHLIEHCLGQARHLPYAHINLQSSGETIPTLFNVMGRQIGWDNLPHFTQTVATLVEEPEQQHNPVWQTGMHRHLREIGRLPDIESRLSRYQWLTDAWFTDAAQFEHPFLLAVDTYEKAPTLFDKWFRDDFLTSVANSSQMRVLIGGQKVPALETNWSFCASLEELKGVSEAKVWMAWAEQNGYQPPSLELLTGVVLALKGRPSAIIELIKTQFPKKSGPIKPKVSIQNQRRLWRENMVNYFTIADLKVVCFDHSINPERLPNHTHLDSFVIEILLYMEKNGRLHELIKYLQLQRPHIEW